MNVELLDASSRLIFTCFIFLHSLQNPDIVLVHYLNVPYPDDNKLVIASSVTLWGEKKEWTKEELISQLKPMCEYSLLQWYSEVLNCLKEVA